MADPATAPVGTAAGNLPALLREHITDIARDGTTLDQFVELTLLKRQLKQTERHLNELLAERQDEFIAELTRQGLSKVGHAESGKTAYINRRIWARVARSGDEVTDAEHAATAAALREAGLPEYQGLKVNVQGLSAYFGELAKREADRRRENGDPRPVELSELLPGELAGLIDLTEDFVLGLR